MSFNDTPNAIELALGHLISNSPSPNKKLPDNEKKPSDDKPIASPDHNLSPFANKKPLGRQFSPLFLAKLEKDKKDEPPKD